MLDAIPSIVRWAAELKAEAVVAQIEQEHGISRTSRHREAVRRSRAKREGRAIPGHTEETWETSQWRRHRRGCLAQRVVPRGGGKQSGELPQGGPGLLLFLDGQSGASFTAGGIDAAGSHR